MYPYDGDVYFSLMRENENEATLITLKINQCPEIHLVKFGNEEYLQFSPGRKNLESFDKQASITKGVKLRIKPDIKLKLYEN